MDWEFYEERKENVGQNEKKNLAMLLAMGVILAADGCTGNKRNEEEVEIQVFIAASLNTVMTELGEMYHQEHPEIKITYNADSSGTLLTQIEEGYE